MQIFIRFILSIFLLIAGSAAATPTEEIQQVRFEDEAQPGAAVAPFVYDPLSGKSAPNASGWLVEKTARKLPNKLSPQNSFTLEAFARPNDPLETSPRDVLPVIWVGGDQAALWAGIRRSPPPHSYNWWQARINVTEGKPVDLSRPLYNGISMVRKESPWRHLAITWDARSKTIRFWLDYRLQASEILKDTPAWDLSQIQIGSGEGTQSFQGLIDEVRVVDRALQPWEFLRATEQALTDVSFAPERSPALPADYGHVDVRLHYGAVGDGVHDDTAAIRRAFAENENRVPIEYQTVYFPAGTYRITDSIRFSRFLVVRGAGPDQTVIRLDDQAPGYATPDVPKPAFAVGYDWPYVGRQKNQRAGNAIGSYIFDLAIDTGRGNPSALGLDFHCNNIGCVENVDIRSGDGQGLVGLDFKRGWPGPCLIKNVSITGFDYGIDAAYREYSLVFSGIKLQDQRIAAIRNNGNILSLEKVTSNNGVPAVENRAGGLVVLIDSQLRGGGVDQVAIQSHNASLYLRDVEVEGYGTAVREVSQEKDAAEKIIAQRDERQIAEHATGPIVSAFESQATGSLKLPIKQTPSLPWPTTDRWVNVRDFEKLVQGGDWSPAIQAAIDAGQPVVYFPDGSYRIDRDVILRGQCRILLGGSPKTGIVAGGAAKENAEPTEPVAAFVVGEDLPVVKFHMLSTPAIRHDAPADLVLEHCNSGRIDAGLDCGNLFIEDAGGKFRFNQHQRVWGRQLNPETKGIPEIINDGGQLWILGLKTEYLSTKIVNRNGARTEVLGGLMYPVHPVEDETLPMFINEESDISLIHGVSVYSKNHKIYMRDTQGGVAKEYTEWHWTAGRPLINGYHSRRIDRR